MFVYPDIYLALHIFSQGILPKLAIYSNSKSGLTEETLNGDAILSSRVTPLLRHYLLSLSIRFCGTITDLRKAAATLTGKFAPDLHELMALFLCHSRKTHDKYYRIHLGHDGLSQAFEKLETFQTNPDVQFNTETVHSTNLSSILHSQPSVLHSTQGSQCGMNSFHQTSAQFGSISSANSHSGKEFNLDDLNCTDRVISFSEDLQSSMPHSTPKDQEIVRLISQAEIISNDPEFDTYLPEYDHSENEVSHMSGCSIINDEITIERLHLTENRSAELKLKTFDININKLSCPSTIIRFAAPVNENEISSSAGETTSIKSSSKCRFMSQNDENIFESVFSKLIRRVSKKYPVNRREILAIMVKSTEFRPVLLRLRNKFSNRVVEKKVVNRVRTNGHTIRTKYNGDFSNSCDALFLDISKNTQNRFMTEKRNRSIFLLKEDEHILLRVFEDLIQRVVERKRLDRFDIISRMKHKDFIPVMTRLKNVYCDEAYVKLISKVRTVGFSLRNKPRI